MNPLLLRDILQPWFKRKLRTAWVRKRVGYYLPTFKMRDWMDPLVFER